MLPLFKVRHLKPAEFRQAWPLVNMAHPDLSLARWLAFARRTTSGSKGSGLIVLEDQRGFFHALAVHRIAEDVEKGRMLRVQPVICARLPGRHLDDVLAAELMGLASEMHCAGVIVETPVSRGPTGGTAEALLSRGYVPQGLVSFAPASPPVTKAH
jgi:hypothetical protein